MRSSTSDHDRPLAAHPLRRGVVPAHPGERLAVRGQDPILAPAGRRALRLLHPPPALRQILLAVAAGVLLRSALGARVRGPVRRHRRRPRAHRRTGPLRHRALRLLRLQRQAGDPGGALRGLLRHQAPERIGTQRGPVPRGDAPAHPRPARHRRQAHRVVRLRRRARHPALHAHRRVRQLREHGAGPSRAGGVRVLHPRRRLLPQLLRHPEGRCRRSGRRPRTPVHHRRLAHHDGRRDQRLQHRRERHPQPGVQRHARLHRAGGAGACWSSTATTARSTRTWTRPST